MGRPSHPQQAQERARAMAELRAGKATPDEIAKRLGVDVETVAAWRVGDERERLRRVHKLVRAARECRSWELTRVGDRDALRLVSDASAQLAFLTAAEVAAFREAMTEPAPTLTIEGLPACTWDLAAGTASGRDESGMELHLHGSPADVTPAVSARVARFHAAVLARRDELLRAAAEELTPLYNKTWRSGPRLSSAEIAARLTWATLSLELDADGDGGTLYLGDGDLFGGHSVVIDLSDEAAVSGKPHLAG